MREYKYIYIFDNRIPKIVLCINVETTRLRGRPRNRWQDEVRENGRVVGGNGWKERVYSREEWKTLLRTARNCHILHMALDSTPSSLRCIAENLNVSKNGAFLFLVAVTLCLVMSHCVTTVVPVLSPGNLWLPRSCFSTGS